MAGWLKEWSPVLANLAALLVAVFAIVGAAVATRKYVVGRVFNPIVVIEVDARLIVDKWGSRLPINVRIRNVGTGAIVVRGDATKTNPRYASYVSAIPMTQADLDSDDVVWSAESEVGYVVDAQSRMLRLQGRAPSEVPREYRQELAPGAEVELPFLIALPTETVAARVRAQFFVSNHWGRRGAHFWSDKVVTDSALADPDLIDGDR